MKRIVTSIILVCTTLFLAPWPAWAFTINSSPVGNPGNAVDPGTGSLDGAVEYAYNIGTF